MREPGVPQPPNQHETLVDHTIVDLGLADLFGPVEELCDEEVLALWGHLDDSIRRRSRDPDVAQQAGRVVLVLDKSPYRLKWCFVLETAIEDRPTELVPPVSA